ncbi:molybdopterin molybdotransferase MoeA [Lacibacter sediminis]|uniref:Molybdopterin molybdenumtransferase n=1 Tax=Lacibacter sediminis TaxID=2760713 RepID=A0A7G5XL74_9BACT|nr:gephyrin-like molybdotransferase Glp [Lacibacter sediminis]QNA46227.1 molybdopterin molybdotransferase MoeA [Lacibacter sediminis]
MITVTEAKHIISNNVTALKPVTLPLLQARGKVLSTDVFATVDIPAFPQSAMDGYAFAYDDLQKELVIEGEMAAGSSSTIELTTGKAIRIFTGAPVPAGADTVVMQEKVKAENGILIIEDDKLQRNSNVRPVGSEIKAGELALPKGSVLTAAAIGFLAGIGVTKVEVIPDPVISILLTGNELQQPGNPLSYGQVYESNSYSLTAALQSLHLPVHRVYKVEDNPEVLTATLQQALDESDLVLLTGGVSVGDYDFVLQAAEKCGVTKQFHKIKQRPGKPLFFGTKDEKLVFGLPGNPSSVITCFYEYVTEALALQTKRPLQLKAVQTILAKDCIKPIGLSHFQKAYYDGEKVLPLTAQESYKLNSFATANCLLMLEGEKEAYKTNDPVTIHLLPV